MADDKWLMASCCRAKTLVLRQAGGGHMAQNLNGKLPKLGRSKVWTPHVIEDIQAKAELGHYQIRGFSTFFKSPHSIS
jgi:hypothetical protein